MCQDQKPLAKAVDDEDSDYSPMTKRGPDGRAHKTTETDARESVPKTGDDDPPHRPTIRNSPD